MIQDEYKHLLNSGKSKNESILEVYNNHTESEFNKIEERLAKLGV